MDMSSMSSALSSMSSAMSSMSMDMASSATSAVATAAAAATSSADAMAGMTMTATSTAASSTSTAMAMSMGSGSSCKISMLWNWYTIDACFISKSWHITSRGMFGGSCVGVFFFVMAVELVRRMHREYDRYIVNQWKNAPSRGATIAASPSDSDTDKNPVNTRSQLAFVSFKGKSQGYSTTFHPTFVQQFIRATFYVLTFGSGYLVMLLAMYYNGYIIISLFLGAFFGYLIFGADVIADGLSQSHQGGCC